MPTYRATFVNAASARRLHPPFTSNATDRGTLEKEAVKALRAIPFVRGEWNLEDIKRERDEDETPIEGPDEPQIWEATAEQIIDLILAGEYKPGAKIPSPNKLAEKFGITPSNAYRAVRYLKEKGWVYARRNRGTYLRAESAWPEHERSNSSD